jgi:hypothetical protein
MGQQMKQAGNSATPFSGQFTNMLSSLLMGGGGGVGGTQAGQSTMGANPVGQTQAGGAGILSNILSPGAGVLGGAYQTSLNQTNQQNIDALRARFGSMGGTSLGTPGSSAEAMYRAYASPQQTMAIGNLQLGALSPLLQGGLTLANRGVTTPYLQASPFTQALQTLGGAAAGAGSLMSGLNMAGILGGGGGGGGNQFIPQYSGNQLAVQPGFGSGLPSSVPQPILSGFPMASPGWNPYQQQQMGYGGAGFSGGQPLT